MDEMHKLVTLCEHLQAEGVIKIVKINQEAQSNKKVSDSIIVEKI